MIAHRDARLVVICDSCFKVVARVVHVMDGEPKFEVGRGVTTVPGRLGRHYCSMTCAEKWKPPLRSALTARLSR